MLPGEQLYLSAKEEIRWTVHVWWGTDMLAQSAISKENVEVMPREAECELQETAAHNPEGLARLTQETGTTFGRVEEAFGDMDSRVESMDASLQQLREQHEEQK